MRRDGLRDVGLGEGRRRAQNQFRARHRRGDIGRDQRDPGISPTLKIRDADGAALRPVRVDRLRVAPPQPDLVSAEREIAGGGKRSISASEDSYFHAWSPGPKTSQTKFEMALELFQV